MSDEPAVVFIGPMGAGKTSIGRRVAKRIGRGFADTDSLIVREHGPIADIFRDRGEEAFRSIEREAVRRATAAGGVVALGGGAVLAPETRELLARHRVILLTVSERTVASRIRGAKRPLLNAGDALGEWRRIMAERRPIYDQLADVTFDTSTGPVRNVVEAAADWAARELGIPLASGSSDSDQKETA